MPESVSLSATTLESRIASRQARVGVIGMGYVGLPLTLLFSEQGLRVSGFDIDQAKVDQLNAGSSYIVRIPASEIQEAQAAGFRATSAYTDISEMDTIIVCVPTPLDKYHQPDLSFIEQTARAIAPNLREGQLVILESTTYPGTTEEVLIPILEAGNPDGLRAVRKHGESGFYVAFSPEREDPGNDTVARRDIPKVIGGLEATATKLASALYGTIFNHTVPVSSPAAAEMTKLLENIYRCVNIALVNELKQLCDRMHIDIFEVIDAAKTKPFGFQAFYPDPGLGAQEVPERLAHPGAGAGLQARHRRPARVAFAHHHRTSAQGGSAGGVQRSLLPHRGPRPPLRAGHDLHSAGGPWPVRRCADCDRPQQLRLSAHRRRVEDRDRHAQRDEGHRRRKHCALLGAVGTRLSHLSRKSGGEGGAPEILKAHPCPVT